jgi:hypothetical protein
MVDKPPFEIPPELRDLTEKNIEQARAAYGQFMDFLTQTMNAWSGAPSNAMAARFRAVQERAIGFAKENAEASFALASELASAKDMQEVLALQSRYAQNQIQTYARQVQELGRLTSEAMRDMQPKE